MRAIVCGDMHLKQEIILPRVEACARGLGCARVFLMGDYVDGPWAFPEEQPAALALLRDWAARMSVSGIETTALMGNHDAAYVGGAETSKTMSVFNSAAWDVSDALGEMALPIATNFGPWLLSHAGATAAWAAEYAPEARSAEELAAAMNGMEMSPDCSRGLCSVGRGRGGFGLPGPLWAHRGELISDPFPGISQIASHTPRTTCERVGADKPAALAGAYAGFGVEGSSGGLAPEDGEGYELWFVDTHAVSMDGFQVGGDGSLLFLDDEDGSAAVAHPEDFGCEPWEAAAKRWMEALATR